MPMVTEPALRAALLGESQLLSALRPVVVEGRQIQARNEAAYAARSVSVSPNASASSSTVAARGIRRAPTQPLHPG